LPQQFIDLAGYLGRSLFPGVTPACPAVSGVDTHPNSIANDSIKAPVGWRTDIRFIDVSPQSVLWDKSGSSKTIVQVFPE
jgi:hypothetical protein